MGQKEALLFASCSAAAKPATRKVQKKPEVNLKSAIQLKNGQKKLMIEVNWEADTVADKTVSSCMITMADRKSRYLLLKKIPKKNSIYVRDGIIELLQQLPSEKIASVTPDGGKEFSRHSEITNAMNGLQFYFHKPHAPWERGTNENTNGLIREYCPKSIDLETFDDNHFTTFTAKLNRRPRNTSVGCLPMRFSLA